MTDAERIAEYRRIMGKEPKLKLDPRRKPQETHGLNPAHICGDCEFFVRREYGHVYFKCSQWVMSASRATDIKKSETACMKFKQAREGGGI